MGYIARRFANDGFGSSMGNYSILYAIHKITGHIPAVIYDIPKNTIKWFNRFDPEQLDHFDVFPNFAQLFKKLHKEEYDSLKWDHSHTNPSIDLDINTNYTFEWFQTKEMWINQKEEIINYLFKFDSSFIATCQKLLPTTTKPSVGVSYRSEYFTYPHPNHMVCDQNFYRNAMKYFDPSSLFIIFSDDIDQAKIIFKDLEQEFNIHYTNNMNSAKGMCMMSLCDHQICANSGFAFWSSLLNLNKNKIVVCPYNFLTIGCSLNGSWFLPEWRAI